MKTLILGIGNAILGDDGVGLQAARALRSIIPEDAAVEIQEASCGGLALMEKMVGFQRAILIDALVCEGEKPGAVFCLSLDDLQEINRQAHPAHLSSSHDTTFVEALNLGKAIGIELPEEILIYGIVIEPVWDFCDRLSSEVETAVAIVTTSILDSLHLQHGNLKSK